VFEDCPEYVSRRVRFLNNICPYEQRFNHGFEAITQVDCAILGIGHVILIDALISEKDGRKIEQALHYSIDYLPLGQRLHHTPGAGTGSPSTVVDGKRRVVGLTFLPPHFFENNPDIVIVGSYNGRNGI
jgi:hypothetical protein